MKSRASVRAVLLFLKNFLRFVRLSQTYRSGVFRNIEHSLQHGRHDTYSCCTRSSYRSMVLSQSAKLPPVDDLRDR